MKAGLEGMVEAEFMYFLTFWLDVERGENP